MEGLQIHMCIKFEEEENASLRGKVGRRSHHASNLNRTAQTWMVFPVAAQCLSLPLLEFLP